MEDGSLARSSPSRSKTELSFLAKRGIQVFAGGGNSAGTSKNLDSSLRSE